MFRDLRWGVYVVFEAPTDYVARCFAEYGLVTDPSGRYAAMYKPYHLIGLELGISVASGGLRGEATGAPTGFRGDVVATAKRDLAGGEMLDGEGGYTVWGKLMPAADSLRVGGLPIGLAPSRDAAARGEGGRSRCAGATSRRRDQRGGAHPPRDGGDVPRRARRGRVKKPEVPLTSGFACSETTTLISRIQ